MMSKRVRLDFMAPSKDKIKLGSMGMGLGEGYMCVCAGGHAAGPTDFC